MSAPSAILLFAAGLGTRMAPLTDTRPKPMVKVAGRALLDHALDHCEGLRTVVNVHYFADQIRDHLVGRGALISDETDMLRETGGGLKHAKTLLNSDPVYTMNTDAAWHGPNPVQVLATAWDPKKMESLLLMIPTDRATAHSGSGDFDLNEDQRLTRGNSHVYCGVQIIRTQMLEPIEDRAFSMWELWNGMLERGTMYGAEYSGQWCDVGRPESIAIAEGMLRGEPDV